MRGILDISLISHPTFVVETRLAFSELILSECVLCLQDRSLAFHELCALYASTGITLGHL